MQRYVSSARAAAGIRFHNWIFSEPEPLANWMPPRSMGLYSILLPDFTWAPRPFQPLYFGEFGPNLHAGLSSEEYTSWFRAAAGKTLYVAFSPLLYNHPAERSAIRDELVRTYSPLCNQSGQGAVDLTGRLDELERKNREQEALLRLVVSAFGRFLEPTPEPRSRRIGFAPK